MSIEHQTPPPALLTVEEELLLFNEFASKAWGNTNAFIKSFKDSEDGPEKFKFIDLGRYSNAFRNFFAGPLKCDKILITQEYEDTYIELKKEAYRYGAIVTGQPGIGKTIFDIYILVRRLGAKQAVVLQFPNGHPCYALFHYEVTYHNITTQNPLANAPTFLWALCDSNHNVQQPAGIFYGKWDKIRIIQTTSPQESRWKAWKKQQGAEIYVMDIWSEDELRNLAILLGQDPKCMVALAEKWGNIPRVMLEFLQQKISDGRIERAYQGVARTAVARTPQFMAMEDTLTMPADLPSPFFFLRPLSLGKGEISRCEFEVHVGTKTLWEFLGRALQVSEDQSKLSFYKILSQHSQTCTSAGNIFESWFHSFVVARKSVSCNWLKDFNVDLKLPKTWQLPDGAPNHRYLITGPLKNLESASPPYYWVTPDNYPGIDGFLVLNNWICAFQATISSKHRSPEKGIMKPEITKIRQKVQAKLQLKHIPFGIIFVGPKEDEIKGVAEEWQGKVHLLTNELVPIGWSKLDPTAKNVTYKACKFFQWISNMLLSQF
ncbi:hypothetical protein JVU11DRAFT_9382 [Chiua virens]|nr:hypothetical protein JVU11DRAFT_9382 [Chiua virens]